VTVIYYEIEVVKEYQRASFKEEKINEKKKKRKIKLERGRDRGRRGIMDGNANEK
jgi:hypothetical protein